MSKFSKIGFTIYAVTNMEKSRAFYEGVLGLVPSDEYKDSKQWVEYDIGPDTLTLGCSPETWKPSEDGAVAALETPDFDGVIKMLKEKKVEFKVEPQDYPGCKMAVIKDPDRNNILIHQKK